MSGYTSYSTLLISRTEQGGLAGLIGATTGLALVVSPTAGTAFYGVWAPLPVIVGTAIFAVLSSSTRASDVLPEHREGISVKS